MKEAFSFDFPMNKKPPEEFCSRRGIQPPKIISTSPIIKHVFVGVQERIDSGDHGGIIGTWHPNPRIRIF